MLLRLFIFVKTISTLVNNLVVRYPVTRNLGYLWNYGSLAGLFLVCQLITGIFLAMFYIPHVNMAFQSVDHIMHDIAYGWLIRLIHLNSASFFSSCIYIHMFRGIYHKSYTFPRTSTWLTGVTIYLLSMATAFLGYVLPRGQMSYWAATVITNLLTVVPIIGFDLVYRIWGGFCINNATLNRFSRLHYLIPFILCVVIFLHLILLHKSGSSNVLKSKLPVNYNVKFYPFYIIKDLFTICISLFILFSFVFFKSELSNHSTNYIHSNPLVTPVHIAPEWHFSPFYAILRSISQKEIGIIYMFLPILILYILPKLDVKAPRTTNKSNLHKCTFWFSIFNWIFLGYLGSQATVVPITELSLLCTWLNLYYLIMLTAFISKINSIEVDTI